MRLTDLYAYFLKINYLPGCRTKEPLRLRAPAVKINRFSLRLLSLCGEYLNDLFERSLPE